MFQNLKTAFSKTFDAIAGKGKLKEADVLAAAREIKLALLSADVHFTVVKDFVERVSAQAVGEKVLSSITPAQQFTKIVHDELIGALGKAHQPFDFACSPPLVTMVVGLQGSGKTTTAARFALICKKMGRRPLLVSVDVYRPAAIAQLKIMAEKCGVDFIDTDPKAKPVKVAKEAKKHAEKFGYDTLIIDTAGRLHIDRSMMEEVEEISKKVEAQRIIYVADSMTGQDAVKSAKAFNELLEITGVVLTKLDGDARGGAALSVKAVTGKPILYVGTGERIEDLEPFYPERMAGRILGMGDVVSLVEQVQASVDQGEAEQIAKKISGGRVTFDDFVEQLKMMKKMGPLEKFMGMIPGFGAIADKIDPVMLEKELRRKEAMISSMTRSERSNPKLLNGSRRKRIASGSGVSVTELNRFIKEFERYSEMMKKFSKGGMKKLFKGLTTQAFS